MSTATAVPPEPSALLRKDLPKPSAMLALYELDGAAIAPQRGGTP